MSYDASIILKYFHDEYYCFESDCISLWDCTSPCSMSYYFLHLLPQLFVKRSAGMPKVPVKEHPERKMISGSRSTVKTINIQ